MFETEALKALGAFPLVQAALALMIVGGGLYALLRGAREKNGNHPSAIPQWLMMGPAHDAMSALHHSAEQSRKQNDLLERQNDLLEKIVEESRQITGLLELIRNESRLR
jgi:hypothetical protein